ncbi:DUF4974 domain-containing protein [Aurantibacter crassamenti]|uniref:FecR family protein n=1 Tax=Aurantibacter crassamenti TaxID=1837375 RepID=UPI001939CD16|nr:FecR family protein [Aurantibacter crassamenti]MBM1105633.1 DUF4974 domain-containing protein [Aurantibacter crassamenti]
MEKSIEGTLTDDEQQLLNEFQVRLAAKSNQPHFESESQKKYLKDSTWADISKHLNSTQKVKNWKLVSAVAAVFLGVITVSYIYWSPTGGKLNSIDENAITLELDDGTVKVLNEGSVVDVFDKSGAVLGRQNKSKLIYEGTEAPVEKLVYNTLNIPHGKTFEILLSDGTIAHLNAGSSLRYPIQFLEGKNREVYVEGEVFLDVAKDSLNPFIVNVNDINIRVLGTQFNVQAYPEDSVTAIVLVEGSVGLYERGKIYQEDTATMLAPGFKASFNPINKKFTKEAVVTNTYTSWMDGELVFRDMSFDNILKKLERHYAVTIINENQKLSKVKFNASFGKVSLDRVLENLKIYHGIKYTINKDIITIN